MITITAPATERGLLSLDELRTATGVDSGYSAELLALGARVESAITAACGIVQGGATPPTLRAEEVTEVFRPTRPVDRLVLARSPVAAVVSIVEDGVTLTAAEYETDGAAATVYRLDGSDQRMHWPAVKVTIVYTGGWATVPDDLKLAAAKLARLLWEEDGVNAPPRNLKRERTEGVDEMEYWVPPASDPLMSGEITDLLRRFIHYPC